jgi:hypothetical protein
VTRAAFASINGDKTMFKNISNTEARRVIGGGWQIFEIRNNVPKDQKRKNK